MAVRKRGKLKRSRGFTGMLFVVFGSFPRRNFKATTMAIIAPTM